MDQHVRFLLALALFVVLLISLLVSIHRGKKRARFLALIETARLPNFKFRALSERSDPDGSNFTHIHGSTDTHHFELCEEARADSKRYRLILSDLCEQVEHGPEYFGRGNLGASADEPLLAEVFPNLLKAARIRNRFLRQVGGSHATS